MLDEIRDLNRRMFEAFKPDKIEEVDGAFGLALEGRHGRMLLWKWTPATCLEEAVACRPKGRALSLMIYNELISEATYYGDGEHNGEHREPAAAVCLALLAWREHHEA